MLWILPYFYFDQLTSPVVSVVAFAVHEFFEGVGTSEGALKGGVYLFGC